LSNCTSLASGPSVVPCAEESPITTPAAAVRAISRAWSARRSGTSTRVGALQDWPLFMKQPRTPLVTAAARSTSSSRMFADLPPSSCATRFTVGAAAWATWTPARVEPVKETMSTSGCAAMAAPTVGPSPFARLKTPAGTPAASSTSAISTAFSGAISVGFSTIVQPAASAGATLHMIWFTGQFHGVMRPHTPTGSFTKSVVPCARSNS
jgi:hypothetical protein